MAEMSRANEGLHAENKTLHTARVALEEEVARAHAEVHLLHASHVLTLTHPFAQCYPFSLPLTPPPSHPDSSTQPTHSPNQISTPDSLLPLLTLLSSHPRLPRSPPPNSPFTLPSSTPEESMHSASPPTPSLHSLQSSAQSPLTPVPPCCSGDGGEAALAAGGKGGWRG